MPGENEVQLVLEAQNGGGYALAQLLQQNYAAVYRYMLKMCLDAQMAADITQDTMVKAIEKFALYDPQKSAFSTWLITIAKNIFISKCRRDKLRQNITENMASEQNLEDTVAELVENDEMLSALRNLSEKTRVPVLMKHAAGYSCEEIAKALKIPVGTVKSRISNGLKALRKELEHND